MEPSTKSAIADTAPEKQAAKGRRFILAGVASLFVAALLFLVYSNLIKEENVATTQTLIPPVVILSPPLPSALVTPTPLPASSPTPTVKPSPPAETHATRSPVSSNPVSTSGNQSNAHGPVWIRLKNGVRIEADEVWSTKDGFWYRRNGLVTFVKATQVKSIERGRREAKNQPAIKLSTATAN